MEAARSRVILESATKKGLGRQQRLTADYEQCQVKVSLAYIIYHKRWLLTLIIYGVRSCSGRYALTELRAGFGCVHLDADRRERVTRKVLGNGKFLSIWKYLQKS